MEAVYSAAQIALKFLDHVRSLISDEDEEYLTNLKLQKLLYYAQGASLAQKDRSLFPERIEHWEHGPVVPAVYRLYSKSSASPIKYDEDYDSVIDDETSDLSRSKRSAALQKDVKDVRSIRLKKVTAKVSI